MPRQQSLRVVQMDNTLATTTSAGSLAPEEIDRLHTSLDVLGIDEGPLVTRLAALIAESTELRAIVSGRLALGESEFFKRNTK